MGWVIIIILFVLLAISFSFRVMVDFNLGQKFISTRKPKARSLKPIHGRIKYKSITYVVNGSLVTFSDGKKGEIILSDFSYYSHCSIMVEKKEMLYKDIDCACLALYEYIATKSISNVGFVRIKHKAQAWHF